MRSLILVAALLSSTSAFATCQSGNTTVLTLEKWTAAAQSSTSGADVSISLKNNGKESIRMVDGVVWFSDTLGGSIGGIEIDRDFSIAPNETKGSTYSMAGFTRLLKANADDIKARVAVCGVVYDDGSKEEFK